MYLPFPGLNHRILGNKNESMILIYEFSIMSWHVLVSYSSVLINKNTIIYSYGFIWNMETLQRGAVDIKMAPGKGITLL